MSDKFSGIEARLEKLKSCLGKLEPFKEKSLSEIQRDVYFKDIIERNFEVAAQCILDISNRVISIVEGEKPIDYFTAILIIGDLGVIPEDFAKKLAPIAGFRNVLVHLYLDVDWNQMYRHLQDLSDLYQFINYIQEWLKRNKA